MAGVEGMAGARQLQDMLATFLADVEAGLENGTLQPADAAPAANAAVQEHRQLLAQLATEQALLQSRLQRFEQVSTSSAKPIWDVRSYKLGHM